MNTTPRKILPYFSALLLSILFAEVGCSSAQEKTEYEVPLTDARLKEANKLIAALDDGDFDDREHAINALAKMGEQLRPLVETHLRMSEQNGSAELQKNLRRAAARIKIYRRQQLINQAEGELSDAIAAAAEHYLAPDKELEKELSTKNVTFKHVNLDLDDAITDFMERTGTPCLIDPELAHVQITLSVSEMKANEALGWIVRLSNAEYVIRGSVIIVTNAEHAKRLRQKSNPVALPPSSGNVAWTLDETQRLANAMVEWFGEKVLKVEAGAFVIASNVGDEAELARLLTIFSAPDNRPRMTTNAQEIYDALSREVDVYRERDENILSVLDNYNIGREAGLARCNSRADWIAKAVTGFDALYYVCKEGELFPCMTELAAGVIVQSRPAPAQSLRAIVDLRPALKAGILAEQLVIEIERIATQARAYTEGVSVSAPIHGCVFVKMDLWNIRRLDLLIRACAQSGRLGAPVALPDFISKKPVSHNIVDE